MQYIYASVEIGTKNIKFLVSEMINEKPVVLFSDQRENTFEKNNEIKDLRGMAKLIDSMVDTAKNELKINIAKINLVMPSIDLEIKNVVYTKKYENYQQITLSHVNELHYETLINNLDFGAHKSINLRATKYNLNSNDLYYKPINRFANEITLFAEIFTISKETYLKYITIFDYCNVGLLEIIPDCLCVSEEISEQHGWKEEAVIIDMGYKFTTITHIDQGKVKNCKKIMMGGFNIDKDINYVLHNDTLEEAESLKLKFPKIMNTNETNPYVIRELALPLRPGKTNEYLDFTSNDVPLIISSRVNEILSHVKNICSEFDIANKNVKHYITGGTSNLDDMTIFLPEKLKIYNASIYRPKIIGADSTHWTNILGSIKFIHNENLNFRLKKVSIKSNIKTTFFKKASRVFNNIKKIFSNQEVQEADVNLELSKKIINY